jgi:hypothetical protein
MSGTAIGIGVAVILFLVVLYFVFSGDDTSNDGDDTSNEVAEGEEVSEPEVNDPPCSDFECGEGLEVKQGELGTTSQQCCQKPLCPADICSANNVEFKDPIENARGDTLDECCQDALCSADICNVGYMLSGTRLGRTNDECCIQKPLCVPDDGTDGPGVPCNEKTHIRKPDGTRGSTEDECCISKSCQVNGFGDVVVDGDSETGGGCAAEDLEPKDNLDTLLGYTKEVCCQQPLCRDDITCPEGKTIDSSLRGSDAESCCVPASCAANGWNEESFTPPGPPGAPEIQISKCRFYSNQTKTRKDDLENVIGNSVDECCEEKLCSNNYFYDENCGDGEITATSPCFKLENIIPGKPLSIGSMKKNCANFGKKLAPDGTLMPVSGDDAVAHSTCCVPLTCGELKEKPDKTDDEEDAVDCGADSIFNPEGLSEIAGGDSSEKPCCSASTCAEAYQGTDKCSDPATYGFENSTDLYRYSRYGVTDDEVNVKVENMKYDITKGTSPAGPGCCIPKTCADLGFNDEKCRSKSGGVKLSDPSKAGNHVVGDGVESCCRGKPCSQQTEEELNNLCGWNMTKKPVLPTEGEGSAETCCEYKKCADIGWDDAKCKDREYTRASVRGKAKKDADGESISLDDTSKTDETETGAKWKAEYAKTNTDTDFEGDKYCCEQDLENNFARMCVGNEWRNGVIHNLSPGANITPSDGHPIQEVPGQNYDSYYGKTSEQCMNTCKDDDRCTSFTLGANTNHAAPSRFALSLGIKHPAPHSQENPSCRLYQKLGSSVNVNDIISSEWGHKRTSIQYFSGKTFPEKYRYSGGEIEARGNKFLTCDNKGLCNDQWGDNLSYKNKSNRPQRHSATTIAWGDGAEGAPFNDHTKRKEIYLAGVDREFCPVDFVKHYGTWRNDGSTDTAGTWHGMGSEVLKMGDNTEGLWKNGSASRSASGNCIDHPDVKVNDSLDDCYRNLNCDWSWFTGSQNDPASSEMYKSPINSTKLEESRRVCHKKNFNKNTSEWAHHMPNGGASVSPTRMIVDGKLKFGVMPDKNPKSGDFFWKNMIITSIGDSSQAD